MNLIQLVRYAKQLNTGSLLWLTSTVIKEVDDTYRIM